MHALKQSDYYFNKYTVDKCLFDAASQTLLTCTMSSYSADTGRQTDYYRSQWNRMLMQ